MTLFKFFIASTAALVSLPVGVYCGGRCNLWACDNLARHASANGGPEMIVVLFTGAVGAITLPLVTFTTIMIAF